MRVLITGGAGFIGSHIAELLAGQCEIRVLDNLDTGSVANLGGIQVEFIHASILDRAAVRRAVAGVDYVFHLAAKTSVAESMQQAVAYNEVNTVGTLVVLEEAAQAGVRKLVFSSSAAVYGDNPVSPKHEALAPEPKSPYAITKLDGEYYCQMYAATQRLPTLCLRYFNVFGPRQNPRSDYAGVIPLFATKALNHQPICIHGDGLQTRDFVYVWDVAAANVHFARQPGEFGVFNIASGRATSINDLAGEICRATNSQAALQHGPARAGDIKHSLASVAKARAAGFQAACDLSTGMQATIEFYRQLEGRRDH